MLRHGPVDEIKATKVNRGNGQAPAKECPECQALIAAGFARCPECGFVFPPPERQRHDGKASEAGVLSAQVTTTTYVVEDVRYSVHTKRGATGDEPKTLRVDYQVGWQQYKSEWICFEHSGYARQKAIAWWRRRSPDPVPETAERAIEVIDGGGLAPTLAVKVRSVAGDPYERIIGYELGPIPEPLPAVALSNNDSDEVWF